MIAVIRIHGQVKVRDKVEEALFRLRIRKKYACVVLANPEKSQLGAIEKLRDFIAYGTINKETLEKLLTKRAQAIDKTKKIDVKHVIESLGKGKKLEELNVKPFFRLHPPRGGIDSKVHFPKGKGVLGNQGEEINKLIERML